MLPIPSMSDNFSFNWSAKLETFSIPGPMRENCNFSERFPLAIDTPAGKALTPDSDAKSCLRSSMISVWLLSRSPFSFKRILMYPLFTWPRLPRPTDEKTLAISESYF